MKFKIKPFLLGLLKENLVYILSFIILIILVVVMSKISIDKINKSDTEIKKLEKEVSQLNQEVSFYQNTIPSSEKLDDDIVLLNNLIPNIEDYFTMIYALENLSQQSGFFIVGYTVDIGKSTANKLRLTITGVGDSNSFVKFLSQYNFSGGRLITSDKIELDPQKTGSIGIDVTFYNKSVSNSKQEIALDGKIFQDIESIKSKVKFDFGSSTEESLDLNYPRKSNPF